MSSTGTYGAYGSPTGSDYPPGPAAWSAGLQFPLRTTSEVYANDLNQQVSVPVGFLSRRPYASLQSQFGFPTMPSSTTPMAITMDAEIADAWGMHSNSGDTSQLVIPAGCDGYYLVTGEMPLSSITAVCSIAVGLSVNGSAVPGGVSQHPGPGGATVGPAVADLVRLSAGGTVALTGWQTSGFSIVSPWFLQEAAQSPDYTSLNPAPRISMRWVADSTSGVSGGTYPATTQALADPSGTVTVAVPALALAPTTPSTWTTAEAPASATFNSDVRASALWLASPPVFRAHSSAAVTVATSTRTAITLGTSDFDTYSGFSTSTGLYTVPFSGLYMLGGIVSFPGASGAYYATTGFSVTHSGTTLNYAGPGILGRQPCSTAIRMLRLSAGDTIGLYGFQASGSSLTTVTGVATRMFGLWVSA